MTTLEPNTPAAETACAPRSLWGWSPPPRPADTGLQRLVDRALPRTGMELALFYGFVIALLLIAPHLSRRPELIVEGLAVLAAGSWCALNFWRCRHAHCLITGTGWLALAAFVFAEGGLGRTLIHGFEQPIFLGVLAVGVVFEVAWVRVRGSNAIGAAAC